MARDLLNRVLIGGTTSLVNLFRDGNEIVCEAYDLENVGCQTQSRYWIQDGIFGRAQSVCYPGENARAWKQVVVVARSREVSLSPHSLPPSVCPTGSIISQL